MAARSTIEWTQSSWNFISGCSRQSPGCLNCYAASIAYRFSGPGLPYEGLARLVNGKPAFTGKVKFNADALNLPRTWKNPRFIFVNSMSDLFHRNVSDDIIDSAFNVMAETPRHTYQVLTKNPQRMIRWLARPFEQTGLTHRPPYSNVILGASIEDAKRARDRFPNLCLVGEDGWRTMVSMEPLLQAVEIPQRYLNLGPRAWVIVGGESGPGARPFNVEWAEQIVAQCRSASVNVFVKQVGSRALRPTGERLPTSSRKGGDMAEWPEPIRVREMPAPAVA
ncbi:MAG TPA: DUF5131 family protein [Nevskiaceae bacterium]|nr:DUF5131 family protein [Nevskiaceae bacterium]